MLLKNKSYKLNAIVCIPLNTAAVIQYNSVNTATCIKATS